MAQMRGEVKLEIVAGATHLFEEPGTLQRVAELAGVWFTQDRMQFVRTPQFRVHT